MPAPRSHNVVICTKTSRASAACGHTIRTPQTNFSAFMNDFAHLAIFFARRCSFTLFWVVDNLMARQPAVSLKDVKWQMAHASCTIPVQMAVEKPRSYTKIEALENLVGLTYGLDCLVGTGQRHEFGRVPIPCLYHPNPKEPCVETRLIEGTVCKDVVSTGPRYYERNTNMQCRFDIYDPGSNSGFDISRRLFS